MLGDGNGPRRRAEGQRRTRLGISGAPVHTLVRIGWCGSPQIFRKGSPFGDAPMLVIYRPGQVSLERVCLESVCGEAICHSFRSRS